MYMITNAAAGIQCDLGKQSALAAELVRAGDEICELDSAVTVTHMFAILNLTFISLADHR